MKNIITGITGIATLEVAPLIGEQVAPDISEITRIIVQIVIGIVTLIGIFRKSKK